MNLKDRKFKQLQYQPTEDVQVTSTEDYLRFWELLKTYAGPFWIWFVGLLGLNLLVAVSTALTTFSTAAILEVVTGNGSDWSGADQVAITMENLTLNNIGQALFQVTGMEMSGGAFQVVLQLAGISLGLTVLTSLLTFGAKMIGSVASLKTARAIQYDLFSHLLSFSLNFFNTNSTGKLMSRLEVETKRSVGGFQSVFNAGIVSPILIIFFSVLTFRASWLLFVAIIVAGAAHHSISLILNKPIQRLMVRGFDIVADLKAVMLEAISSIRVVKSFGAEQFEIDRFRANQIEEQQNSVMAAAVGGIQNPAREITNQIIRVSVLLFGAYELFVTKNITLPTCLLFIFICNSIVAPIRDLGSIYITIHSMMSSSKSIYKYFKLQPEVKDGEKVAPSVSREISLENVNFTYSKHKERYVLHDINLKFPIGKTTALVGPSGSGKSTLVDLLLRFYDPVSGVIRMDGMDLREFQQRGYRKHFGIVSQESLLFNATVRDNINYGRKHLTEDDLLEAARISNSLEFIKEMSEGFDTIVGDRGVKLSGGQRQRIAIARAIVGKPDILILDEATSALDSQAEREVQKAIEKATENTTAIIIAHRLSTITHADNIVVMEAGRVVGQGNHESLLRSCSLYQDLCRLQFSNMEA